MIEPASLGAVTNLAPANGQAPSAARVDAFAEAMQRHGADQVAQATPPAGAAEAAAPAGANASSVTDAQARARTGLDLGDPANAAGRVGPGDMILDGIQKLRGVFDAREARVSDLMTRTNIDAGTMMAVQMEVANFTLLVDISSKLTGKSTQAFDTLMKGQ